jgi:hypothetical protein
MKPVILMRPTLSDSTELNAAKAHFDLYENRTKIPPGSLVIGRYSVLPFYKELEEDLKVNGSTLINTYSQHRWIADMREWYQDFEGITPKTWFELHTLPDEGPFVVKGETNSRKFNWNTHMFAKNKQEAIQIHSRLSEDSLIGQQNIYIRKYEPLVKLGEGLNGLPVSEEYRFFFLDHQVLSGAFYWSSHVDDLTEVPKAANVPQEFLAEVKSRIGFNARFVVVDIARKVDGTWMVVEINDGQQSGVSENDPNELYSNMKKALSFLAVPA